MAAGGFLAEAEVTHDAGDITTRVLASLLAGLITLGLFLWGFARRRRGRGPGPIIVGIVLGALVLPGLLALIAPVMAPGLAWH